MISRILKPFHSEIESIDSLHDIFRFGKDLVDSVDGINPLLPDYFVYDEESDSRKWNYSIMESLSWQSPPEQETFFEFLQKKNRGLYEQCIREIEIVMQRCTTNAERRFIVKDIPDEIDSIIKKLSASTQSIEAQSLLTWVQLFHDYFEEKYSDIVPLKITGDRINFELDDSSNPEGIKDVRSGLIEHEMIDDSTNLRQLNRFFGLNANTPEEPIKWIGKITQLHYFIRQLVIQKKIEDPKSDIWKITSNWIVLHKYPQSDFSKMYSQKDPTNEKTLRVIDKIVNHL